MAEFQKVVKLDPSRLPPAPRQELGAEPVLAQILPFRLDPSSPLIAATGPEVTSIININTGEAKENSPAFTDECACDAEKAPKWNVGFWSRLWQGCKSVMKAIQNQWSELVTNFTESEDAPAIAEALEQEPENKEDGLVEKCKKKCKEAVEACRQKFDEGIALAGEFAGDVSKLIGELGHAVAEAFKGKSDFESVSSDDTRTAALEPLQIFELAHSEIVPAHHQEGITPEGEIISSLNSYTSLAHVLQEYGEARLREMFDEEHQEENRREVEALESEVREVASDIIGGSHDPMEKALAHMALAAIDGTSATFLRLDDLLAELRALAASEECAQRIA